LCKIYSSASQLLDKGTRVISCDEKTGIQALERQLTPMKKGQPERRDSNYKRHGTQCLIASFEVATGKIIMPSISETRTEKDFLAHIKKTVEICEDADWIIILDQLNTHKSASLVEYVNKSCELKIDLGKKGKSGILKNLESRTAFLSDETHKIRFFYTPKHASWLNQIEVWFSILSRRLLKRLSAKSKDELREKILNFIDFFNSTSAKAFKWVYQGKSAKA
jgi:transposase